MPEPTTQPAPSNVPEYVPCGDNKPCEQQPCPSEDRQLKGPATPPQQWQRGKALSFSDEKARHVIEGLTAAGNKMHEITLEKKKQPHESVFISECNGAPGQRLTIQIHGKAKNVCISACRHVDVLLDACVSTVDLISCDRIKVQALVQANTITTDKCSGCQIFLPTLKEEEKTLVYATQSDTVNIFYSDPLAAGICEKKDKGEVCEKEQSAGKKEKAEIGEEEEVLEYDIPSSLVTTLQKGRKPVTEILFCMENMPGDDETLPHLQCGHPPCAGEDKRVARASY